MLIIEKPGLLTTIQDLGRYGFKKDGIITSGAMDTVAHRVANLLVNNDENEPTLEITLHGPTIRFMENTIISLSGGDLSPFLNGIPMKMERPIWIHKGDVLTFGRPKTGCRAYLAVRGGFKIKKVMGSYSTYLRAKIGGFKGRALQRGDQLELNQLNEKWEEKSHKWSSMLSGRSLTSLKKVRVIQGRHYEAFTNESRDIFLRESFKVSAQSDRMGYRLEGQTLELAEPKEIISEAVSFGTIQVPANGMPIVLMADSQTIGGYPKIAEVISVDLPVIAQAKPGDDIQFELITIDEAQELYRRQENELNMLRRGIELKFS